MCPVKMKFTKLEANYSKNLIVFIESFQNKLENSHILEIQQCPTTNETLELISRHYFKEKLKTSKIISIILKINEPLSDKHLPSPQVLIDKPLLISIESEINQNQKVIYCKGSKSDKYLSLKLLNGFSNNLGDFIRDFLIEYLDGDNCGDLPNLSTDNIHLQVFQLCHKNGCNILMKAIENENIDIVRELLSFPIDINSQHRLTCKRAIDIAWEKKNNEILLLLLKAGSVFPENFYSDEASEDVQEIIQSTSEMHQAIVKNNRHKVEEILEQNKNLKYFYNLQNISAATIALKYNRIKIYRLLIKNNIHVGPNENICEIVDKNSEEPLRKIRKVNEHIKFIHDESSKNIPDKHLMILISNSCFGHDDSNHKHHSQLIQEAFKFLNKNPLIRPILEVVAASKKFKIHFDFNRTSILFMDPTSSEHENGTCYYMNGQIYIAAKDLLCESKKFDVFGVIAHELCHYVLHLVFRNSCKPFAVDDSESAEMFNKILDKCRILRFEEKIICDVFNYKEEHQEAELIVRVPQILTKYSKDSKKLDVLEEVYNDLFNFFKNEILPKLLESLEMLDKIANRKVSWNDLSSAIKAKIENSFIEFQGCKVKIKDLMNIEILQFLPSEQICAILAQEVIKISSNSVAETKSYIERNFRSKRTKIEVDLNGLVSECEAHHVILLSDKAGSGKSTTFKNLIGKLKNKGYDNYWISFIDLKRHLNVYKKYENIDWSIDKILEILNDVLDVKEQLEIKLFKNLFKIGNVVLLWDGVDEISPNFKEFIIKLMFAIRTQSTNKQWISTRPHCIDALEMIFQRDAYEFKEYDNDSKILFIKSIISENVNSKSDFNHQNCMEPYQESQKVNEVLKFFNLLDKKSFESINNLLILKMITEIQILGHIKVTILNSYSIYEAMIEEKKKILNSKGEISNNDRDINSKVNIWQVHQIYALKLILRTGFANVTNQNNTFVDLNDFSIMKKWKKQQQKWTPEIISRYGFLIIDNWGLIDEWGISWEFPDYIHRTFAEFFVAQFLIENIYDEDDDDVNEYEMELRLSLLYCVFYRKEFNQISKFLSNFIDLKIENGTKEFCDAVHKLISKNGSHKIFASKFFIQNESILKSLWHLSDSKNSLFEDLLLDESTTFNYFLDVLNCAVDVFKLDWPKYTGFVEWTEHFELINEDEIKVYNPDGKIQYDNYRIFSVLVENEDQLKFLKENEAFSDEYQFIDAQFAVNKKIRVVVPPHKFAEFDELIKNLEIETILVVSNLQEIIEEEKKYNTRRSNNLDWTRYWKLDEIHSWLKQLASKYPNDVELINVGKSYEEREILGIKLNKRKELGKKQIVFEGTMHAREWISAATVTWMLNELITSKDPLINKLAETYEWNIIPVVNVDGYEFSWTNDRLWRKTRKPSVDGCFGTDPNRNFDIFHNLSIPYPCDQTYPGAHPFSELETKQYSEFLKSLDKFVAFFSFHSYSQLLMFPYGYKEDHPNNYDVLYAISKKAVKALSVRFGTKYKVGTIEKCLGKTAGSSIDWVQDKLNPNLTYVYELRDTGTNGFELPASQIIDNSLEVFDSLVTILNEAQMRGIA